MKNGKSCYVEWDSYAAQWLRNLVSRGLIADGDVKECSVTDIVPSDLAEYSQVHLYAGIGVWSYSLRRAGIPDTANVWTFSEPCQPFSDAGKGLGFADDRYLRPYTNHLIEQCRPSICLGEQVASNDGLGWLDVVQTDMERAGYACGALDTCSAGFGAPHIRQRLRVCAVAEEWLADPYQFARGPGGNGSLGQLVHAERAGLEGLGRYVDDGYKPGRLGALAHGSVAAPGGANGMADAPRSDATQVGPCNDTINGQRAPLGRRSIVTAGTGASCGVGVRDNSAGRPGVGHNSDVAGMDRPGPTNGHWADADWLFCRDGKWRPVEPGTFPLAHGATSRVGRLRAYGNAVDAEATTSFCRDVGEVLGLI
jgi:DNA (cytosine-5)-methyltransferase 1